MHLVYSSINSMRKLCSIVFHSSWIGDARVLVICFLTLEREASFYKISEKNYVQ